MRTYESVLMSMIFAVVVLFASGRVLCQTSNESNGQSRSTVSVAGFVEEIHGTVFLKRTADTADKDKIKLHPKHDVARRVYPGEQVQCEANATIKLRLGRTLKQIDGPSPWFTIPLSRSSPSQKDIDDYGRPGGRVAQIQRALDSYGRLGGRDRSGWEPLHLFTPSGNSWVNTEGLLVRWNSTSSACNVSLAISQDGHVLWQQTDIQGSTGVWQSKSASQAVAKYQKQNEPLTLALDASDSCGNKSRTTFSLISVMMEAALKEDLSLWDSETEGLLRRIGRAYAFEEAYMYQAAAEEYEEALKIAPNSQDLLIRTISAFRKAGDYAHEDELKKRLIPGIVIPE